MLFVVFKIKDFYWHKQAIITKCKDGEQNKPRSHVSRNEAVN